MSEDQTQLGLLKQTLSGLSNAELQDIEQHLIEIKRARLDTTHLTMQKNYARSASNRPQHTGVLQRTGSFPRALLLGLPRELREEIYLLVITSHHLHVGWRSDSVTYGGSAGIRHPPVFTKGGWTRKSCVCENEHKDHVAAEAWMN